MASESDFTRLFRVPGLPDMEALAAAQKRNMEALSAANRTALEGAQAVARRHMEMLQQSMVDISDAVRKVSEAEAPEARGEKQAEMMRSAYEKAIANLQELSALIQKSSSEALGVLNKRFADAMEEAKSLGAKPPG